MKPVPHQGRPSGHDEQLEVLGGKDERAVAAIGAIVKEEREHHDRSASHAQAGRVWPKVLSPVVALTTEAVIWLGMHL